MAGKRKARESAGAGNGLPQPPLDIGGRPEGVTLIPCRDCGRRMVPERMGRCAGCWGVEGLLVNSAETRH